MPPIPTKIMLNVGNPELAFEFRQLPNEGVGLARLEFIINKNVGIHPKALLDLEGQPSDLQKEIGRRIGGYSSPTEFYIAKITEGVATIAAAFWPKKVIVRLSDFKSNEYSNLVGGQRFEPHEENPMLGFRGASRYISPEFHDCFALECDAIKRIRDDMGFTNVEVMIPFVRTLAEAEQVIALLKSQGLARGRNGLRVIMMCEIPSNALLADRFLEHFDGFSIGSNDMTQLTLAVDRDAGGAIASSFDERDDAGEGDARDGDRRMPQGGQIRRHLRTGSVGPSGSRAMAGGAGDREHFAQSRYRRCDVAAPRGQESLIGPTADCRDPQ
jgi:pyruvate,water dikinase